MIQIKLPTNKNLVGSRILVNGSEDVVNARELYKKFSINPLSLLESKSNQSATSNVKSNVSQGVALVSPQPAFIPSILE